MKGGERAERREASVAEVNQRRAEDEGGRFRPGSGSGAGQGSDRGEKPAEDMRLRQDTRQDRQLLLPPHAQNAVRARNLASQSPLCHTAHETEREHVRPGPAQALSHKHRGGRVSRDRAEGLLSCVGRRTDEELAERPTSRLGSASARLGCRPQHEKWRVYCLLARAAVNLRPPKKSAERAPAPASGVPPIREIAQLASEGRFPVPTSRGLLVGAHGATSALLLDETAGRAAKNWHRQHQC